MTEREQLEKEMKRLRETVTVLKIMLNVLTESLETINEMNQRLKSLEAMQDIKAIYN